MPFGRRHLRRGATDQRHLPGLRHQPVSGAGADHPPWPRKARHHDHPPDRREQPLGGEKPRQRNADMVAKAESAALGRSVRDRILHPHAARALPTRIISAPNARPAHRVDVEPRIHRARRAGRDETPPPPAATAPQARSTPKAGPRGFTFQRRAKHNQAAASPRAPRRDKAHEITHKQRRNRSARHHQIAESSWCAAHWRRSTTP